MVGAILVVAMLAGAGLGLGTMGRAQVGTLEAVIDPVDVAHSAHVHTGSCDALGDVVEPLSDLTVTLGVPVGMSGALTTSCSFESADPEGFLAAQPRLTRRRIEAARYGAAYRPACRLGRHAIRLVWAVHRAMVARLAAAVKIGCVRRRSCSDM